MTVRRKLLAVACASLAAATVLAAGARGAGERRASDPGVTATSVTIGGTVPLSGVAAAYASVGRGAEAYFKYVNARGGVNGRRIVYKLRDDAYNPANTVQETRELVQSDKVFAVYNSLGTEHNLAIRPFLNSLKVPQIFPATGASTFGRDGGRYPFTTAGFQPTYTAEGRIYGKAIGQLKRRARVAVLYQNDDYGQEILNGVRQGLRFAGRGGRVVASEGYAVTDTEVRSQVARLRRSNADVFLIAATPRPAIQAFIAVNSLGWNTKIIVNAVASASNTMKIAALSSGRKAEGAISIVFLKDPNDPKWRNDRAIRLYRSIMSRYGTGDVSDVYNVYAMASAYTFVAALRKAGRNLTRESLVRALRSLNVRDNPFLLPGIGVRMSGRDPFPLDQARLQRWTKGRWIGYGPLLNPRS